MWGLCSPHRKIERTIHQTCPSTLYIMNDIEFSSQTTEWKIIHVENFRIRIFNFHINPANSRQFQIKPDNRETNHSNKRKIEDFHFSSSRTMPALVSSNSKADDLIAPVEGLDVPPNWRPENITTLIESVDRYNPESLEVLEEYLAQQCSDGTFDCLADLAILKLYSP